MRATLISILSMLACTIASSQGFYPLHIGNRWEYWEPPPPPNYYAWTTRAVKDTIMSNNISYVLLRSDGGIFDQFLRQDGPRVYEYLLSDSSEYVLYDFSRGIGDTVSIRYYANDTIVIRVTRIGLDSVFGRLRMQWEFYEQASHSSFFAVREVTDSIGMTRIVYEPGISFYLRGAVIDSIQYGTITSAPHPAEAHPTSYALLQNYPNPFNNSTVITFRAHGGEYVAITVFDMLGRKVKYLFDGKMPSESYFVSWDGRNQDGMPLASGVYVCQLKTQNFLRSMKMVLLR